MLNAGIQILAGHFIGNNHVILDVFDQERDPAGLLGFKKLKQGIKSQKHPSRTIASKYACPIRYNESVVFSKFL